MDGVGIPIIERPRPLPGHDTPNPTEHPYTLKCEEPYKFRPVLVLACSQDGLLAAMITSASNKLSLPLDTPLMDWRAAGLTKASLVRVDRIALLPPTYLGTAGRIGRLSPRDAHRVSQALAALPR